MSAEEHLSASLEDYLEAIYNIISANGGVRVKDIANRLDVKAGSVTAALQTLTKLGYVNYKPYGIITLTDDGVEQAKEVVCKHENIKSFFVDILGADPKEAEFGACKIEHVITDRLLSRLICFTQFVTSCMQSGNDIIDSFHEYYKDHKKTIREQNLPGLR